MLFKPYLRFEALLYLSLNSYPNFKRNKNNKPAFKSIMIKKSTLLSLIWPKFITFIRILQFQNQQSRKSTSGKPPHHR